MKFHAPVSGDRSLDLPLLFGHFVPWYTIRGNDYPLPANERALLAFVPLIDDYRHWNDSRAGYGRTHHHMPAIGLYDSRDPGVIEWQIRMALEYGVSGFIVNWYGKYSAENVITLHWLRGLTRWNTDHPDQPFYYFLSVDSQAQMASEGKKPVDMEEDFGYIRECLMTDAYLRRDGRPLFMVFPYEDNAPRWRKAIDSVFASGGADLIWSGSPRRGGENACYAWVRPDDGTIDFDSPYVWSQPDSAGDGYLRHFFRDANAEGTSIEYIMAGVWPGFNDQLVSWAWNANPDNPKIRPRVICRETMRGNTLALTWKAYLDYLALGRDGETAARIPAPLIQLVTWNDYAETTSVEPTRDYSSAPLEMCRKFLAEARKAWPYS